MPTKKRISNRSLSVMPKKYPEMSQRLMKLKHKMGVGWEDIAKDLNAGITIQTLSSIGRGEMNMNFYIMQAFKKTYNISYDWWIDGTNEPKITPRAEIIERMGNMEKMLKTIMDRMPKK